MSDRCQRVLEVLSDSAAVDLSGTDLASRLGVSDRSVRSYVSDINRTAGRELVQASHRGYRLDRQAYRVWQLANRAGSAPPDTPQRRLLFIARQLVTHLSDGADVFQMAESLSVSPSTIESDLGRARELLREFSLAVRRDHDLLFLEGQERDQRRLVRHVILAAESGMSPMMMASVAENFGYFDVPALTHQAHSLASDLGLELDEYSLNDIVVHLVIAADRVRQGHLLEPAEHGSAKVDAAALTAANQLAGLVEAHCQVHLPAEEVLLLAATLAARSWPPPATHPSSTADPDWLKMVREAMRELADYYFLDLADEAALVSLALHVQNLFARSGQGQSLQNSIGDQFKNMHPLVHEMALFLANRLESQSSLQIGPGEVDFLSFHLGTLFQRQLETGPLVRVTAVFVMPYGGTPTASLAALTTALANQAVITDVITTLDYPWETIDSDLVISSVDLAGLTTVPVLRVSPLLRLADIERIGLALREERQRGAKQRIRSNVLTLIEPELFHHVASTKKQDALALMCQTMVANGVVPKTFLADVLDRESRSSTSFGGQFAIPHSLLTDANRPAISVLLSDKPIAWGSSSVRLVFLFALSPDSRHLLREVLGEAIPLLTDPASLATLLAAHDFEAFARAVVKLLA
ncbi:MAG: PTS sugar transporter subunit IIA [Micrococcales bacterium]|nr:PTS sugar transporter subunit IIA [Micrococcales bacterium]